MTTQTVTAAAHAVADALVSAAPPVALVAPQSWYAIKQAKDKPDEADITIHDAIGGWGITAQSFIRDLKAISARRINVRINTPGGEVFDATAIYNALKEHPSHITTWIDGVAASAGSYIALSGDEVRIADNAYVMIHEAHGGVYGEAEDMRKYADVLETMNDQIAGMYAKKSGKDKDHWRGLMKAETWYAGQEAVDAGLADSVYEAGEKKASGKSAKAAFDFKIYNQLKIPEPVKALWGLNDSPPSQTITNSPATEDTARAVSTSAATPIQESSMAEISNATIVAPAQTPAAGNNANTQVQISDLNQQTAAAYVEHGRKAGYIEGQKAERDRMTAILAATPNRPQLAINAFIAGQDAVTAGLLASAEANAEARANEQVLQLKLDNARLQNLYVVGGHPGVTMPVSASTQGTVPNVPSGMEPEAQAELEWNADPVIRAQNGGDAGKKTWMLYRTQCLAGNVKAYTPGIKR